MQTSKQNLCRDCLNSTDYHHNHTLLLFDLKYLEMKKMNESINGILTSEKGQQIDKLLDNEKNEQINRLIYLLSVIYNDFIHHPNYSHIIIFSNAKTFLDKFIENKNNNKIFEKKQLKKEIKINSKKKLLENITNLDMIIEINIFKSNIRDITDLCEINLINLKKLLLAKNFIINIKPILNANFKDLETLSFAENKLGNDNIEYLSNLDFPNLTELNLYSNSITDPKIFNIKNNEKCLPKLRIFYIGFNIINWDLKNDLSEYNFSSVKEIGLTTGMFDNKTITFIKGFKFPNLETLFLSRNNFDSLSFLDELDLPELKIFLLIHLLLKIFIHYTNIKNWKK